MHIYKILLGWIDDKDEQHVVREFRVLAQDFYSAATKASNLCRLSADQPRSTETLIVLSIAYVGPQGE
jgi:hypothetical protein